MDVVLSTRPFYEPPGHDHNLLRKMAKRIQITYAREYTLALDFGARLFNIG